MMLPWKNLSRFCSKFIKQPQYAIHVASKRLQAFVSHSIGKGTSPTPEAITLFLTYKCNLRCKMCGQWGESGVTKTKAKDDVKEQLSFSDLKKLIDSVSFFKPSITLFGGEPLLYPNCIELIRYIKQKGMHVLMITNASMLKGRAAELAQAGLDELNVSLDGGEKLHDTIRGMEGLFKNITDGLKELKSYKQKKGLKKPLVNLQCTITKYNYLNLEEFLDVALDIGANSLTFHNLIFLGNDLIEKQKYYDEQLQCSSDGWKGFVFTPEIDPEILFTVIQKIKSRKTLFAIDFYPNFSQKGLKEYYNNPSYLPSEYPRRCLSPWVCAYVFPDGDVRPCLNSTYAFGNINRDEFTTIWNSEKAVKFRGLLKKSELFPACVRCTELYRY
ncbi:MAG: radical SAM protein [Candidatus Omnitrophica bacterium]|nr:radical SAM protein [Candidatus Omnitrophota bacterium]